jgi:hypothetical protein
MFAKGNREERERKDCQIESFSFSFNRERREGVVLRKLLTCMFVKTTPFWGPLSPQKPNTAPFWGPLSSQISTTPF